jgi:hypothetical protein
VSAIGNQVRIEASLYDGGPAQPAMVSQASVSGDTTQLFELVDRLAVAAAWSNRSSLIRPNTERAVRLADRLSERDRRLLQSFAALADGRPDDAESGYRGILQDYPDDLEAQWQLATVLNVYNPLRGRPIAEAAPVFEGVVKLDPEFLCPI